MGLPESDTLRLPVSRRWYAHRSEPLIQERFWGCDLPLVDYLNDDDGYWNEGGRDSAGTAVGWRQRALDKPDAFTVARYRKGMSVISSKHQLTLPVEVMRAAGFAPGDDVQVVSPAPGRIEIVQTDALIAKYAGSMPGVYGENYLNELRGEWE